VAEPLREVPEELAGRRVDLFRVEADVVRVRQQLFEERCCVVNPAGARERLDEPEGARDERALGSCVARGPVEQAVPGVEPVTHRRDRAFQAFRCDASPLHACRAQERGVEPVGARVLRVRAEVRGPAALLDELRDPLSLPPPAVGVLVRDLTDLGETERPVECHPRRDERRGVVAVVVELPDAAVMVLPDHRQAVDAIDEHRAGVCIERIPVPHIEIGRLEQVSPRAELQLARRRVAVAHRA
jgi:hypothetical protein